MIELTVIKVRGFRNVCKDVAVSHDAIFCGAGLIAEKPCESVPSSSLINNTPSLILNINLQQRQHSGLFS
jgi:hypothetical protein